MIALYTVLLFVSMSYEAAGLTPGNSLVIEELGLLLEPEGLLVGSYEDRYVHLVYDYNHIPFQKNASCGRSNNPAVHGEERVKSLENLLKLIFRKPEEDSGKIPCISGSSNCTSAQPGLGNRKKRFLGTLLVGLTSLFGVGTSLSNTITLREQEAAISFLKTQESIVERSIAVLQSTSQKTIQALDNLYILSKNEFQKYDKYFRYMECELISEHYEILYHEMLRVLESRIKDLIGALLTGDVNPGMIPIELLRSILSTPQGLDSNYLSDNPSIIYQVGRVYPISLNVDKKRIHFLLQIPIIKSSDVTHLYHILNFGFSLDSKSNKHGILKIQEQIGLLHHNDILWPLSIRQDSCAKHNNILFCRFHPIHKTIKQDFMKDLINYNISTNRTVNIHDIAEDVHVVDRGSSYLGVSTWADKTNIIHTRSGISILNCKTYSLIKKIRTHVSVSSEHTCRHYLTFVAYTSFETLVVHGTVIQSPLITNIVEHLSYNIDGLEDLSIPPTLDIQAWEKLSVVLNKTKELSTQQSHYQAMEQHLSNPWVNLVLIIISFSLMVLIIGIGYITFRRLTLHKRKITNTQELSLAMSSLLKKQHQEMLLPYQVEKM
ncbi:putative glycoprotein [Hubei odonate virus 10]|uniref:Putative glycoprotein n=1 Tax=Hubei odonate virus 10 TaxID=1922991 RepID=A0A1L3KMV8_9MONO|nr:putative glycoprotein [Hubei odonate virus 10]APG78696.1 putative glycoprotein [Hubei odonate virus 10]